MLAIVSTVLKIRTSSWEAFGERSVGLLGGALLQPRCFCSGWCSRWLLQLDKETKRYNSAEYWQIYLEAILLLVEGENILVNGLKVAVKLLLCAALKWISKPSTCYISSEADSGNILCGSPFLQPHSGRLLWVSGKMIKGQLSQIWPTAQIWGGFAAYCRAIE